MGDKPKEWAHWIHLVEFFLQHFLPCILELLYGRDPSSILKYGKPPSPIVMVDQQFLDKDNMLKAMKIQLRQAQICMKLRADQHHREVEFQVEGISFLCLKPY